MTRSLLMVRGMCPTRSIKDPHLPASVEVLRRKGCCTSSEGSDWSSNQPRIKSTTWYHMFQLYFNYSPGQGVDLGANSDRRGLEGTPVWAYKPTISFSFLTNSFSQPDTDAITVRPTFFSSTRQLRSDSCICSMPVSYFRRRRLPILAIEYVGM